MWAFVETGVNNGSTSNHFDGFDETEKPKLVDFPHSRERKYIPSHFKAKDNYDV